MLRPKLYFYYSKNDSKKEAIDKISASNKEEALQYFSGRKNINEEVFLKLYTIEKYEKN